MSLILCGPFLFGVMGVILMVQGIKGIRNGQLRWGKELLEGDRARKRGTLAVVSGLLMVILGWGTMILSVALDIY